MDESWEIDRRLRKQIAHILDLWTGQNHSPPLHYREIQALLARGYIDMLGNVTLKGFEFLDEG